jgi:hypothetical protein
MSGTNKGINIYGGTLTAKNVSVGDGSTAGDQVSPQLDLQKLSGELRQLREALQKEATEEEHKPALDAVDKAERAAKEGNVEAVLDHLKKAGKWALDVATKIGVSVASDVLKTALK